MSTMTREERTALAVGMLDTWLEESNTRAHVVDNAVAEVVGWLEDLQHSLTQTLNKLTKVTEEDAHGWDRELVQFPAKSWDEIITSREGLDQAVAELRQQWSATFEELTA